MNKFSCYFQRSNWDEAKRKKCRVKEHWFFPNSFSLLLSLGRCSRTELFCGQIRFAKACQLSGSPGLLRIYCRSILFKRFRVNADFFFWHTWFSVYFLIFSIVIDFLSYHREVSIDDGWHVSIVQVDISSMHYNSMFTRSRCQHAVVSWVVLIVIYRGKMNWCEERRNASRQNFRCFLKTSTPYRPCERICCSGAMATISVMLRAEIPKALAKQNLQ